MVLCFLVLGILLVVCVCFSVKMRSKDFKRETIHKCDQRKAQSEGSIGFQPISIYYGTQTGTSEDFSNILEYKAKQRGLSCQTVDLDDFRAVRCCLRMTLG